MPRIAWLVVINLALAGCTPSDRISSDAATHALQGDLSSLNVSDPVGDVRAHLAEGDFRPIGLGHGEQSWSCTLPGQQ